MVFRRDKQGGDAFQRQISALRQQLGSNPDDEAFVDQEGAPENATYVDDSFSAGGYEQESPYQRQDYPAAYSYEDQPAAAGYESPVPSKQILQIFARRCCSGPTQN